MIYFLTSLSVHLQKPSKNYITLSMQHKMNKFPNAKHDTADCFLVCALWNKEGNY